MFYFKLSHLVVISSDDVIFFIASKFTYSMKFIIDISKYIIYIHILLFLQNHIFFRMHLPQNFIECSHKGWMERFS